MDRLEAGDISRRFPVADRVALFIDFMLGENASQISLPCLGRSVTSIRNVGQVREAYQLGAQSFLLKPSASI